LPEKNEACTDSEGAAASKRVSRKAYASRENQLPVNISAIDVYMSLRRTLLSSGERMSSSSGPENGASDHSVERGSSHHSLFVDEDAARLSTGETSNEVLELHRTSLERSTDPTCASSDMKEFLACLSFLIVSLVIGGLPINPRQRPIPYQLLEDMKIYVRNQVYNERFEGETIPDFLLLLLAIILPFFSQIFVCVLLRRAGDRHRTVCVYLVAFAITLLVIDFVKLYVGYLRPIFYVSCEPDDVYESCTDGGGGDVRKSFPSGHAGTAFCGMTLIALYLHTRVGVPSVQTMVREMYSDGNVRWTVGYSKSPSMARLVSILSLTPLMLALFIAASRVVDNKHFPADVVGGSVLRASIAVFTHSLWFP